MRRRATHRAVPPSSRLARVAVDPARPAAEDAAIRQPAPAARHPYGPGPTTASAAATSGPFVRDPAPRALTVRWTAAGGLVPIRPSRRSPAPLACPSP
jgi:hypothetical protein